MRKVTKDAANDSERRYTAFRPGERRRKAPVLLKHGRELKCSLESLSIPPSHTHTSMVFKFDSDSVFIHNCKLSFGEFDWASYSPPPLKTPLPIFPLFLSAKLSSHLYMCTSSNHSDWVTANRYKTLDSRGQIVMCHVWFSNYQLSSTNISFLPFLSWYWLKILMLFNKEMNCAN